jgi:hypothetical protein
LFLASLGGLVGPSDLLGSSSFGIGFSLLRISLGLLGGSNLLGSSGLGRFLTFELGGFNPGRRLVVGRLDRLGLLPFDLFDAGLRGCLDRRLVGRKLLSGPSFGLGREPLFYGSGTCPNFLGLLIFDTQGRLC